MDALYYRLTLWQAVNLSCSAFDALVGYFADARGALAHVDEWRALGLHANHITRARTLDGFFEVSQRILTEASSGAYGIIDAGDAHYPRALQETPSTPPFLFYLGDAHALKLPAVAVVGTRTPCAHAHQIAYHFARHLALAGVCVISGMAQGIDAAAHDGALDGSRVSIGILGTGILQRYPRQNHWLYDKMLEAGGLLLTEMLPNTRADKFTFPRRNRLLSALAQGVVVCQARQKSGTMITARYAGEFGRQVFAIPDNILNENASGCHHLIREGATLVTSPQEVLMDLGLDKLHAGNAYVPTRPATNHQSVPTHSYAQNKAHSASMSACLNAHVSRETSSASDIPPNLVPLYQAIKENSSGLDLDALMHLSDANASSLLGDLVTLEMLGVIQSQGGLYVLS